jgi:hypothetical protein
MRELICTIILLGILTLIFSSASPRKGKKFGDGLLQGSEDKNKE